LRRIAAGRPDDPTVAQLSVAVNRLFRDLDRYLNPPLIALETSVVQEPRQAQSFSQMFLPGMIFMAFLFVTKGLAADIWNEQARGTLRRLKVTPAAFASFLAGRVLAAGAVCGAVAAVSVAAMIGLAGVPVASPGQALLWLFAFSVACFAVLLLLCVYASGPRAADLLTNLIIFPLMLLGGSMFPFESMPAWMANIGRWTPNGWAVVRFRGILAGAVTWPDYWAGLAALTLVSAVMLLVAVRRLSRGFLR
jgi:ABC-type multidrug transport system permease subunit